MEFYHGWEKYRLTRSDLLLSCVGNIVITIFDMFTSLVNHRLNTHYTIDDIVSHMGRESIDIYLHGSGGEGPRGWSAVSQRTMYSASDIAHFRSERQIGRVTNALLDALDEDFPLFEMEWLRALDAFWSISLSHHAFELAVEFYGGVPLQMWRGVCEELMGMDRSPLTDRQKEWLGKIPSAAWALGFPRIERNFKDRETQSYSVS